jgi:hypothetical protein
LDARGAISFRVFFVYTVIGPSERPLWTASHPYERVIFDLQAVTGFAGDVEDDTVALHTGRPRSERGEVEVLLEQRLDLVGDPFRGLDAVGDPDPDVVDRHDPAEHRRGRVP